MNGALISSAINSAWSWCGLGLALIIWRGLYIDVMDVDASQYASISMEMVQGGSWLQVMHRMGHYLDKPPLLFWLSAFSFTLFGFSTWAYKLPSMLAALVACWALYRFARLFYGARTACCAAFTLASSVGFLLLCNDVRTDTLLLAMTVCAVWQLAVYQLQRRWLHLVAAFFFTGLAMLAKGPIGLMLPAWAMVTHLLWKKDWKMLLDWRWLAGLLVTAGVLAPMCWGLWQQFDCHPERVVNGRTGVSGLYFFFWEQSFGRITGENVWKNDTSVFYFLHIYLWAFAPWAFVLGGVGWRWLVGREKGGKAISANATENLGWKEAFSIGGFFVSFVALSLSKYKLPHYIFVTLPWASVLVANGWSWLVVWFSKARWAAILLFYFPLVLMFVVAFLLLSFVFPTQEIWLWLPPGCLLGWLVWRIAQCPFPLDASVWVQRGVLATLAGMFVMNFHFYPRLLTYQSTSAVAHYANLAGIPAEQMGYYGRHGHALDFYSQRILPDMINTGHIRAEVKRMGGLWLYTTVPGKADLDRDGIIYEVVKEFSHFQVALLSPQFLNPDTRDKALEHVYLLRIVPSDAH